jgi:DNA polymerase-3 subunit epsilon
MAVIYNFGKNKNKTVEEVHKTEPGYYGWMIDADFPLYTKQVLRKEMDRIKNKNLAKNKEQFENKLDALQNKFKK